MSHRSSTALLQSRQSIFCNSRRSRSMCNSLSLGTRALLQRNERFRLFSNDTSQEASVVDDASAPAVVDERQELLNFLDIRTGKILSVTEHEEADSLFVETIDVGDEDGPRTIVSGLRPYMPASDLEGKECIVLCNLKPRNMRGVKSHGMLLCASDKEVEGEEKVEILNPKDGTPVGERLCFGSFVPSEELPAPDGPNKIQKKKIWEKVQADLKTDAEGAAKWKGLALLSSAGQVTCASLKNS